jgi:proteasome lid subunit RPN8/RPN11
LSADEIVFSDVSFREPKRLRRPDRDRAYAAIAYELPGPEDLPIFLDRKPADAIERHALRDTDVELGGILLGYECVDDQTGEPFVWITQALEAKHYENTQASFTYTHDSWEEITRERDAKFPDLDIVGWYHTHPDFGVFLSSHDLFIHHNFFSQPLQVAYVVDPIRQTRGFFQWRDGAMVQVGGFHISGDRRERQALVRLVNDLENLPDADGGSGFGLSPRLEAELIAMLSRPQQPVVVDRAQTAAVFTTLGVALTMLVLAGVLWLGQQLRSQTRLAIEEALAKSSKTREETLAEGRVAAKEKALDDLTSRVAVPDSKERFLRAYLDAKDDRAKAQKQIELLQNEKEGLELLGLSRDKEMAGLREDLVRVADEVKRLRDARDKLEASNKDAEDQANEAKKEALMLRETDVGKITRKYAYAWYAAAGGLVGCLALGCIVVVLVARQLPEEQPPEPEKPHRIDVND